MEPVQYAIGSLLLVILGWLVTRWIMDTLSRLRSLEDTESEQNVKIAVIQANMEHIRTTGDQTSKDVKKILELNGNRATG
jgi:hypothetical protein